MSVELTGSLQESFESAITPTGLELIGEGRLRRLAVEFGDGWGHPVPSQDAVGADLEHELGVVAQIRVRSGQRMRLEVTLESIVDDMVTVPSPVLRADGPRPGIWWAAGASAEVALPSSEGPGHLEQRRGLASPGADGQSAHLWEPDVVLRPRQLVSSAWTYQAHGGDLLDLPAEPTWLPWSRYVTVGDEVEFSAPDGNVMAGDDVPIHETDGEFLLTPPAGLSSVYVWGAGGRTEVEIGAAYPLDAIREDALQRYVDFTDDHWCYLAARQAVDGWSGDELVDRLDRSLGELLERPTAWAACAAHLATGIGLPLETEARDAATAVLANPTAYDVILLAVHGLAPVDLLGGGWPVGDFEQIGLDAIAAVEYGRITTSDNPPRGREVAIAKLFAAGLGESERGLRAAAYAQAAENRLLCALSMTPLLKDVAWLSL